MHNVRKESLLFDMDYTRLPLSTCETVQNPLQVYNITFNKIEIYYDHISSRVRAGNFSCLPNQPCRDISVSYVTFHTNRTDIWSCSNAYGYDTDNDPPSCLKPESSY